jgi:broad specificity phosphatase PhoE
MAGGVILVRHGEPALSRRVLLTAAGYRQWWARYEEGGLKAGQSPPSDLLAMTARAGVILSSTRERSRQSALAIAQGRPFASDALFIEAPLPSPPAPSWFRLSPRWWGVVSRFWWRVFDYHDGQESHAEASARAARAAGALAGQAAAGSDVLLIAHGYFNFMIGQALAARGWRRTLDQGFRYWSVRRFEPPAAAGAATLRPSGPVG